MDASRFDNLTRAVGRATSRRRALAILAGGTAALAVPALARGVGGAWAQDRRAGGTSAIRASFQCSGDNTVEVACTDVGTYLVDCGMYCPSGTQVFGKTGCTTFEPDYRIEGDIHTEPHPFRGWRAWQYVTATWFATVLDSSIISVQPPNLCCAGRCHEALGEWTRRLWEHELAHQQVAHDLMRDANFRWGIVFFEATGTSEEEARINLLRKVGKAVEAEDDEIARKWNSQPEPPSAGSLPCAVCAPKEGDCDYCAHDGCRRLFCGSGETCCNSPVEGKMCCFPTEHCCPGDYGGCCPNGAWCCGESDCCENSQSDDADGGGVRVVARRRGGR